MMMALNFQRREYYVANSYKLVEKSGHCFSLELEQLSEIIQCMPFVS